MLRRYETINEATKVACEDLTHLPENSAEVAREFGRMIGEYFHTGNEALALIDGMLEEMNFHQLAEYIRTGQR